MNQPISEHARFYGRLDAGSLLKAALKLYAQNLRLALQISLPLLLPAFLPVLMGGNSLMAAPVKTVLLLVGTCVVRGALIHAFSRRYYGQYTGWTDAFCRCLARSGAIFSLLMIMVGVILAPVGVLFALHRFFPSTLAGIEAAAVLVLSLFLWYAELRWSVGMVATLVDRTTAIDSLRRSWDLTGRAILHTLATIALAWFVAGIFAAGLNWLFAQGTRWLPPGTLAGLIAETREEVIWILFVPFLTAVDVCLYYDLRHR